MARPAAKARRRWRYGRALSGRRHRPRRRTSTSSTSQFRRYRAPPARNEWNTKPTCARLSACKLQCKDACRAARKSEADGNNRAPAPPAAFV